MNKPQYPCPFTIVSHNSTVIYGKMEMDLVASLEKARKCDRARHMTEWLEYELHQAREYQHKVYCEYTE